MSNPPTLPGELVMDVPTTNTVVVFPSPGPPGPAGGGGDSDSGSLTAETVGEELVVTVTSKWGITPDGLPYYDPDGAAPDDAAIASLDAAGNLVLRDIRGAAVPIAVTSVNGHTGALVTLTKADVGLGNVADLAPADLPISDDTQDALDLKAVTADLATVATTGAYADLTGKPTSSAGFAVAMALVFGS